VSDAAVFLDRDGVVNADPGEAYYVKNWAGFRFVEGAAQALGRLRRAGFRLVVVSNQSGVARGAVKEGDLADLTRRMRDALRRKGADLAGVYYCPHDDADACACRKPKPGLFLRAAEELGLDLGRSFSVGDSERDVEAGRAAGLRSVLVLGGKSRAEDVASFRTLPDYVAPDLADASRWILEAAES
jgi:histidinol-phosphate phosphatase family protein